jgi:hypothetical protein
LAGISTEEPSKPNSSASLSTGVLSVYLPHILILLRASEPLP